MANGTNALREWIARAKRIVFFGGAGVSTESGIPDFRGTYGLYQQERGAGLPPYEEMLSISYFRRHPDAFWAFYREVLLHPDAQPNAAHKALARLEARMAEAGGSLAVVTQNIDGLHQAAGSRAVYELHGSALRNFCKRCGKPYPLAEVLATPGTPRCACGGLIRPDVVLYGETLPGDAFDASERAIAACELLIVGGTSLAVYPAAGLVRCRPRGSRLALINQSETPMDADADLVLREPIGGVLDAAVGA